MNSSRSHSIQTAIELNIDAGDVDSIIPGASPFITFERQQFVDARITLGLADGTTADFYVVGLCDPPTFAICGNNDATDRSPVLDFDGGNPNVLFFRNAEALTPNNIQLGTQGRIFNLSLHANRLGVRAANTNTFIRLIQDRLDLDLGFSPPSAPAFIAGEREGTAANPLVFQLDDIGTAVSFLTLTISDPSPCSNVTVYRRCYRRRRRQHFSSSPAAARKAASE